VQHKCTNRCPSTEEIRNGSGKTRCLVGVVTTDKQRLSVGGGGGWKLSGTSRAQEGAIRWGVEGPGSMLIAGEIFSIRPRPATRPSS